MASLQPSLGFLCRPCKRKKVNREVSRASRPAQEFGRPPESVVKSCRARVVRPIANDSEAGRQRAKVSPKEKV